MISLKRVNSLMFLLGVLSFSSAFLLFWIQPLIAKKLLPMLGGSPYVWNTNIFFFQSLLLLGYLLSFYLVKIKLLYQGIVYILLLAAALSLFLLTNHSITFELFFDKSDSPVGWLIIQLTVLVGVPFFILSASNILLQNWYFYFSGQKQPFFLFATSNGGSLLALIFFPFVWEPNLGIQQQFRFWGIILGLYLLIAFLTFFYFYFKNKAALSNLNASPLDDLTSEGQTTWREKFKWFYLSFIPSSLLLAVTAYLATDISSFPLLWVLLLSIYLLTFVIAFSQIRLFSQSILIQLTITGILAATVLLTAGFTEPIWIIILINFFFLFIGSLFAHNKLFASKPSINKLPAFYLLISLGGVAGSAFVTLVIPLLFDSLIEYQVTIILLCLILQLDDDAKIENQPAETAATDKSIDLEGKDILLGLLLLAVLIPAAYLLSHFVKIHSNILFFLTIIVPLVLVLRFMSFKPARFAVCLMCIMLGNAFVSFEGENFVTRTRNFFGTLKIVESSDKTVRSLYNGNTIHGSQYLENKKKCEPISYYSDNSPIGSFMWAINDRTNLSNVAVVGLGVGVLSSYGQSNQIWKFYEINPAVIEIAENPDYFSFLSNCGARENNQIILGDARKMLELEQNHFFQLIFLDAFSSDSIPLHLLTSEAFDVYFSKLAENGTVVIHVSSRTFDLRQPIADIAAYKGFTVIYSDNYSASQKSYDEPSRWLVVTRDAELINRLKTIPAWSELQGNVSSRLWTDDYLNVLKAIKWLNKDK